MPSISSAVAPTAAAAFWIAWCCFLGGFSCAHFAPSIATIRSPSRMIAALLIVVIALTPYVLVAACSFAHAMGLMYPSTGCCSSRLRMTLFRVSRQGRSSHFAPANDNDDGDWSISPLCHGDNLLYAP